MAREPHLEEMLHQPLPDDDLGVQAFLDRFGKALTGGDGAAIAEMWETPAFVLGDGMTRTVKSPSEVEALFAGAKDQYNALGITDTKALIVRLDEINDHLVMVRARWPYLDAEGIERGAETSTYTLTRERDGDWKFRITVMQGAEKPN